MPILLSYLSACVAFFTVLVLSVTLWRGRLQGWWLTQALVVMVVWSAYVALTGDSTEFNPTNQTFFDILRGASWSLLLLRLHHVTVNAGHSFWHNRWLWSLGGLCFLLLSLNIFSNLKVSFSTSLFETVAFFAPFSLSIVVLVLLEQWYRCAPADRHWAIKFFCLAILVVFGSDFLLFSEALLFGKIDGLLWNVRGWLCFLVAPLIAISLSRCDAWKIESRMSHQAAFFGSSLFLAGIYLSATALVGYYLQWFGTGLGNAVQVIFVVVSLSLFLVVVTSGKYRSILSVWLTKHFLSYKYDYRQEWMRANTRFASLDFSRDGLDRLLMGVADPLDSPGGVIWVREHRNWSIQGARNVDIKRPLDRDTDASLLEFFDQSGWVIHLQEYREHRSRYQGLDIADDIASLDNGWLLIPLLHQHDLYGVILLTRPRTDRSITWEDHDLLRSLGGQVAALLALRNVSESLADAKQFDAYNQLSTFVVHDIKNVVAQLSLVVRNAEKHRDNPEFIDDALDTLSSAVKRMNRMLAQLKQNSEHSAVVEVSASDVLQRVCDEQSGGRPAPVFEVPENPVILSTEYDRLVNVLCHLVQNAQDATDDRGTVLLDVADLQDRVEFRVTDTGSGMDAAFIQHSLFKPFVTSKGRAGMGIGVYEARQFARAQGGDLLVASEVGKGSVFTLSLPKAPPRRLSGE